MRIFRQFEGPLVFGALWLTAAMCMALLRDPLGGVVLLWLPSAVAVAALHIASPRRWPAYIAALLAAQCVNGMLIGRDLLPALAIGVAASAEALVATWLGSRVLGGHGKSPTGLKHFVGIFLAAVAGSMVSTLLSLPFRPVSGLPEAAWWFLASVLSILTAVPVLIFLRQKLGFGPHGRIQLRSGPMLGLETSLLLVIAVGIFRLEGVALTPLLMVAVVFVTIRHGQMGASCSVIACVIAATLVSLNHNSPARFMHLDAQHSALWLQGLFFLMLATSLPLAAMLMKRDQLESRLRRRAAQLSENLAIFRLSEEVAGLGRWHLDLRNGKQIWSKHMLELNGLDPSVGPDPGPILHLLPDQGQELFGQIAAHEESRGPYSFQNRVKPPTGPERFLRMSILNEFDRQGTRIGVFGVAMDVTEQVRRTEALEVARGRAVRLAAEAQRLANTDVLTLLPNRRHAMQRLAGFVAEATRHSTPLSVVMFDIDHFKRINDTFGHHIGDEVLQRVAVLAQRQARANDLVGRIGGEEFVWLLPGVSNGEAFALAERLREVIEQGSDKGGLPKVTTSVGYAAWQAGDGPDTLLARADRALYAAKEGGRNRVRKAA